MLKNETKSKFQKYLHENALADSMPLGKNGILRFHWANDRVASSYIRNLHEESMVENKRMEELRGELNQLKDVPIWLMSKRGQMKSDLHNLYMCYLDPRLKTQWFELEEILVSLSHEAGPFSSIKAMRWFDKDIYAKFIYLKLLESWVPQRSFRLSLDIPIFIRAGGSPFQSVDATIHQISEHGLVIHVASCSQLKEWTKAVEFLFLKKEMNLVDERGVENCLKTKEWVRGIENFTIKGEVFDEILNQLQGQGEKDNFIFVPLSKIQMLSLKNHDACLRNLKDLILETQATIHKYVLAS